MFADEKSPTPLRNQERGISGRASQESRLRTSKEEVPVKMCTLEAPEVSAYFTCLGALKHLRQTRCSHDDVWKQRIIVAQV